VLASALPQAACYRIRDKFIDADAVGRRGFLRLQQQG
jgi:hypothetical protein